MTLEELLKHHCAKDHDLIRSNWFWDRLEDSLDIVSCACLGVVLSALVVILACAISVSLGK